MNRFSADFDPSFSGSSNEETTSPRASVINRTHRVVRERARDLRAQRSRNRALLVPLLIASSLVVILVSAFWLILEEYEVGAASVPDFRFQLPILLIWFLPVTGALLIVALLRRFRTRTDYEETR